MKNVRILATSEALTENNYAVHRLLLVETSQHSQREGYEISLKGRPENLHFTSGEKTDENKETIHPGELASLR